MKRTSILQGAVTEQSREFLAGERNGWKAVKLVLERESSREYDFLWDRAHYMVDVPKFVENARDVYAECPAGDPHVVYGLGFDSGVEAALDEVGILCD